VIDNKEYNKYRAAGIPEPASVQVGADIKEAIAERREEAMAAINETKEAAFSAYAEHRDDAAYAIGETKIAAQDNIQQTKEALEKKLDELRERSSEIYSSALRHRIFGPLRILRAFPLLYHEMYSDALQSLRQHASDLLKSEDTDRKEDHS
jgi:hypothetical protein